MFNRIRISALYRFFFGHGDILRDVDSLRRRANDEAKRHHLYSDFLGASAMKLAEQSETARDKGTHLDGVSSDLAGVLAERAR